VEHCKIGVFLWAERSFQWQWRVRLSAMFRALAQCYLNSMRCSGLSSVCYSYVLAVSKLGPPFADMAQFDAQKQKNSIAVLLS